MRRRYPPAPGGAHPVAVVRRTGESVLLTAIDAAYLSPATRDPEHRRIVERLGLRSALFVPLVAAGRRLGVLSSYSSSRALDEDDLALATELARRAALAVDNARTYRAARQAARARDEVLGIVSHDLRNPLGAVAMCARALTTAADPETVAELATTIRGAARWMGHIIRDLLDVSAIEAGRLAVYPDLTDVAPVLDAVRAMHEPAAAERGVQLHVTAAADLPLLDADVDRLVQAVGNLLGNAIKFTPAGGAVTLAVDRSEGAVGFRITDTGLGIPAEHVPHLFDRFWQARATRRGGAGLGLAIAKGIAEAHGGRIDVRSAVGRGSTFVLVVPLPAGPPADVARLPLPGASARSRG